MNQLRFVASSSLAILTLVLASSRAKAGTTCSVDADCASGYLCNVVGSTGCAVAPCARGEDCPPQPPCQGTEIRECTPGATCTSDADCSPELRCFTSTYTTCSQTASACSKEQPDCPPPPPPDCQTTTRTQCVSRYQSSCTTSAECGPGLSCVPSRVCGCTASGGIDPNTGEKIEQTETCQCSDGPLYCDLVNKDCSQTSDCPPGWTCLDGPTACAISSDGTTTCSGPTPKQCATSFAGSRGGSAGGGVSVGDEDDGASGSVPPTQGADAGTSVPTGSGGKTGGSAGSGTPGSGTPGSGTPGSGTTPGGSNGHHPPPLPTGGIWCQFSGMTPTAHPTGWSALLGLVGLAGLRRQRCRQREDRRLRG